jgi:hypothetical protein
MPATIAWGKSRSLVPSSFCFNNDDPLAGLAFLEDNGNPRDTVGGENL